MKKLLLLSVLCLSIISCGSDDDGAGPTELPLNANCDNPVQILSTNFGDITSIFIEWSQEGASSFTVEYGELGFQLGSGTKRTTNNRSIDINGLTPDTDYVYYVQANCGTDGVSQFAGPNGFSTPACTPPTSIGVQFISSTFVSISITGVSSEYEVEYGETGFSLGSGTLDVVFESTEINNLAPGTTYDLYARTLCGDTTSDVSNVLTFTTDTACRTPEFFDLAFVTNNSVGLDWFSEETAFEVEYGLVGFEIGSGTVVGTSDQGITISGLDNATTYEFYLRANCGSQGMSNNVGPLVATTDN